MKPMSPKSLICSGTIDISPLKKAYIKLASALKEAESELERDGVIQRFEFTYELAWKTLKKVLDYKGVKSTAPRDIFRDAAAQGLIDDPKEWFEYLEKRNLTVHTYDENTVADIYSVLKDFEEEIARLLSRLEELA